jgi:lipoprotein-anchoring transpeptidase ErfK/SrfK
VRHLPFLPLAVFALAMSISQTAWSNMRPNKLFDEAISATIATVDPNELSRREVAQALPKAGFVDIQNHWAKPFIQGLAAYNLISNAPNSQFRPNQSVSRAEFAAILGISFVILPRLRQSNAGFSDVPPSHWAATAIKKAYEGGFLSAYDSGAFHPDDFVTRSQAMVAIANGLDISNDPHRANRAFLDSVYRDADQVPDYAVLQIAALSAKRMIVNYPDVRELAPNRHITRAELAAIIYQTLVERNKVPAIASGYVVNPVADLNKPGFDLTSGQITRLEVNLSKRQVTAYQGEAKIKTYKIAVGRAGWETPTGSYRVAQRVKSPAWKNPFTGDVIKGGSRDNPLGQYWIGFWTNGKDWSGFHGTPHRETVGQAVSHGCLRMYNEDIKELFAKVSPDTVVRVSR